MRSLTRIDRILKLIGDYWKQYPDLRFGQMMINAGILEDNIRVWNNEDDAFETYLKELIK